MWRKITDAIPGLLGNRRDEEERDDGYQPLEQLEAQYEEDLRQQREQVLEE